MPESGAKPAFLELRTLPSPHVARLDTLSSPYLEHAHLFGHAYCQV